MPSGQRRTTESTELGLRVYSIHRAAEKTHSRKLIVASPATNIPFYSNQRIVTPYSSCLLPGYSHTCCEDLLRGATGCCSRVARELVLWLALFATSLDRYSLLMIFLVSQPFKA
jgi:hypothetical protein